ncbi:MAG TPA: dephospho-CoA kinase [candidate division Zixibacteria bacterium]|nr:dephospho-CoA kinase [candidate division Zixibacteria bacterium]
MKRVGLTGGIASGKSTVAAILRRLGAEVVDADAIAREVVRPGEPAWREIVDAFGREVLEPDGTLDRKKLREIVFSDPAARKRLEAITHPRIRELAQRRIEELERAGARLVVYEAPLFFETNAHHWLRPVILVACDESTQRERLRARDRLSEEEIDRHLEAQMSLEEKRRLADYVIENTGSLADLERKVEALLREIEST